MRASHLPGFAWFPHVKISESLSSLSPSADGVAAKRTNPEICARTEQRLRRPLSLADLRTLGATLSPPGWDEFLSFSARVNNESRTVYFDRRPLEETANRIEFYLVLGALLGMLLILHVLFYQMQDVSFGQLRAFLLVVLPRPVAEYFILKPGAYAEKHRMPGSILFMDIYGFTKTCEKLGQDLETLFSHLEKVMDTVVNELSKRALAAQLQKFNPKMLDASKAVDVVKRLVRVRPTIEGNLDAWEFLRGLKTVFVEAEKRKKSMFKPRFSFYSPPIQFPKRKQRVRRENVLKLNS